MPYVEQSDSSELDSLREKFLEKCSDVEAITSQIHRAKLDVQQLRLRLLASGISDASLIPADLRSGPRAPDQVTSEFGTLIQWLAETVDFEGHAVFDVGGDVQVGERNATMGRMVQWRLPNTNGQKLSVPVDWQKEIEALLKATRRQGAVDFSQLGQLAKRLEIVGAEIMSERSAEPAIFLIHRESSQAMVVGCWPAEDFPWHSTFDPRWHFQQGSDLLTASVGAAQASTALQEAVTLSNHQADAKVVSPPPFNSTLRFSVLGGDRVEVDYNGEWFVGTLQHIEGGMATIQCDVDDPDIYTIAPVVNVRPITQPSLSKRRGHMRAKSMM